MPVTGATGVTAVDEGAAGALLCRPPPAPRRAGLPRPRALPRVGLLLLPRAGENGAVLATPLLGDATSSARATAADVSAAGCAWPLRCVLLRAAGVVRIVCAGAAAVRVAVSSLPLPPACRRSFSLFAFLSLFRAERDALVAGPFFDGDAEAEAAAEAEAETPALLALPAPWLFLRRRFRLLPSNGALLGVAALLDAALPATLRLVAAVAGKLV